MRKAFSTRETSRNCSSSSRRRAQRLTKIHFDRLEARRALAANPAFSISDVTILEGNGGTSYATFTVGLSAPSPQRLSVDYAAADGTAVAGVDYLAVAGRLTFAKWETSKTVAVPILNDALDEASESFFVNLSNPSKKSTIDQGAGSGTIIDDDPEPALTLNDVVVTESESGAVVASFFVSLSAPSGRVVTVDFSAADGTARAGEDYLGVPRTITFAPGQTVQRTDVPIVRDLLDEDDETFTVNLSNATNAVVADGQTNVTIVDNDPTPSLIVTDRAVSEALSATLPATFTVRLSTPSGRPVTVDYSTSDGQATANSDYSPVSGTLTFAPGQTSLTVDVPILGDALDEANEAFVLNLSNPVHASLTDGQGIGTIGDDDPSPSVQIDNTAVPLLEGNSGSQVVVFNVSLTAPSGQIVTVPYTTADGAATANSDYLPTSGTLTFLPGVTTQTISVPVLGDVLLEQDETFFVRLGSPTNAVIASGRGQGTVLIRNDDAPLPPPSISISDATATEGSSGAAHAVFTVTLSAPFNQVVTVAYSTANASAFAGSDYSSISGSLTFLPGQTTQTISVPILDDAIDEADETFFVRLSSPISTLIADGEGVGTIVDEDPAPSFSISDARVFEGNDGSIGARFIVRLSAPSEKIVTVAYSTVDGTATAGSDYNAASGSLTFLPGQTAQTISIPVLGDATNEPDESFFVLLNNPESATMTDREGMGTILNDDPPPNLSFSIQDASVVEGDAGTRVLEFTVRLSGPSNAVEWVVFTTTDGTATDQDYAPQRTGSGVTFLAGVTEQTITIPIFGDVAVEADETFYVNLIGASRIIANKQAVGTILNDDEAAG